MISRQWEILCALWTIACLVSGFMIFAHPDNLNWMKAFLFFMGGATTYMGIQFIFPSEDQIKRWIKSDNNSPVDEKKERQRIKSWSSAYRVYGIQYLVIGPALVIFALVLLFLA